MALSRAVARGRGFRFGTTGYGTAGMEKRLNRIAANEAVFREVNEQLAGLGGGNQDQLSFICECGEITCVEPIVMGADEYRHLRGETTTFGVKPGHERRE